MDIKYIDDLIAVVESKSYNKAAIKRNISTPGIKKRILQIEYYFGYKIFDATSKGVSLTEEGITLYKALKSIKQQIDNLKKQDSDVLKVGIISNFPLDMLYEMNQQHQRIKLFSSNSTHKLVNQLQQDELDLVIGEQIELQDAIHYENWFEEPYEIVFSKNHSLNNKSNITMNDLTQEHFYLLEAPGDSFSFKNNKINPKSMNLSYVKDRESILNFIATSQSLAICPQSYTKKINNDLYTHTITPYKKKHRHLCKKTTTYPYTPYYFKNMQK
ncbi:LysR family transcriptional regulator [Staphylococcus ratti]|uniref:LysR family transcriptional regulator n=1 Tax=Staphylococcus ratti TaxID=2892440 RepID=A0ABY3PDX9_9STAP|nr:LysR family transcriptional regulator [Staphylococcus ratti]UEX90526.1 LysR family transcriptional regulator [Staphylococcus ratti]